MVQPLYSSGRTLKHGIRNGPPAVQIKFQNSLFSSNVFSGQTLKCTIRNRLLYISQIFHKPSSLAKGDDTLFFSQLVLAKMSIYMYKISTGILFMKAQYNPPSILHKFLTNLPAVKVTQAQLRSLVVGVKGGANRWVILTISLSPSPHQYKISKDVSGF